VVPLKVVEGDLTRGDRLSEGTLQVQGSLLPGAVVSAPGDVWIHGDVQAEKIRAGGNVVINGRIKGSEETPVRIQADGSVLASGSMYAEIIASDDVNLHAEALYSQIEAGGRLWMCGHPGALVGGESRARAGAVVRVLGDSNQTPTVLHLGGENLEAEHTRKELEHQAPPVIALVWNDVHPEVTIGIDDATLTSSTKSSSSVLYYRNPPTGDVLVVKLSKTGIKTSTEDCLEAALDWVCTQQAEAPGESGDPEDSDKEPNQPNKDS